MSDQSPWRATWAQRASDFVIGMVSPRRAAVRAHWRRLAGDSDYRQAFELGLRARGYKAAGLSKNHTPWAGTSPRSADAEINADLYTIRNRSRAANRDDALAAGIQRTLVRGVVGTGLRPQARTGSEIKDEALEKVWNSRKDQLSLGDGGLIHGSVQRLRYGKIVEDGEILLRPAINTTRHPDGSRGQQVAPLWIENIEADRLQTPADAKPEDEQGRIVYGVEKDRNGVVVAYWILNKHPGDTVLWNTKVGAKAVSFVSTFSKSNFNRVPADQVCHHRSGVTRPGQTRGVPICAPVMQDLRDLDLFMLASLKKSQISACLSVFLTSTVATTDLLELTAEDYGYQLDQKLEPGMIFRLFPGEKAEFLTPAAGAPGIEEFVFLLVRRIGASIGLSPQAILRAWEGVSYSGARTIKIDDRQTFKGERAEFGGHVLNWEWRIVLEDELLRGNPILAQAGVLIEDIQAVEWIGDEEQWVDPQSEANATDVMLRIGLTSPQIECTRQGRDYITVLRDRLNAEKLEDDMRIEMGLQPRPAMQPGNDKPIPDTIKPENHTDSAAPGKKDKKTPARTLAIDWESLAK